MNAERTLTQAMVDEPPLGPPPDRRLTLSEWNARPDPGGRICELVDGVFEVRTSPSAAHQVALVELACQLRENQIREGQARESRLSGEYDGWWLVPNATVVLDDGPTPTVRAPDVLVGIGPDPGERDVAAANVVLAVEVSENGSRRLDAWTKFREYERAVIPSYWIAALDGESATLTTYRLIDGTYRMVTTGSEVVTVSVDGLEFTIDVIALVSPQRRHANRKSGAILTRTDIGART